MKNKWNIKARLGQEQSGFTLIEMLIVILILGILSGITILSVDSFRNRAASACAEANEAMDRVVDAAIDAGVENPVDVQGDCSGATSGGGVFTASLAASVGGTDSGDATPSVAVSATQGQLLVAVTGHRQWNAAGDPGSVSMPGWDQRGTIVHYTATNQNRRAVTVWTRIADGTSADNANATWTGSEVNNAFLIVQAFNVSSAPTSFTVVGTPGDGNATNTLALAGANGPASGGALMVVGLVGRDALASFSWTGATSVESQAFGATNPTFGSLGYQQVSGPGPHGATANWTGTARLASGLVLIVR